MRKLLEWLGMGIIVNLILILAYFFYSWIVLPIDGFSAPLVELFFRKHIPFLGFLFVCFYFILCGMFAMSKGGQAFFGFLSKRFKLLALFVHGAQIKHLRKLLKARKDYAPTVIMAPFYRKQSVWPCIITRIVDTADSDYPIIVALFLDWPLWKPMTLHADDPVLSGLTFDEALSFSATAGINVESFAKPLRRIRLGDYIKEAAFKEFFFENDNNGKKKNGPVKLSSEGNP